VAWLLGLALLPSVAFTAGVQSSASGPAQTTGPAAAQSHGQQADHDGDVRQCTPDTATCTDVPAFSAAAVVSLAGDVIAAVASDSWMPLPGSPAARSHDIVPEPPSNPPRSA
jgi:hypothetical protein